MKWSRYKVISKRICLVVLKRAFSRLASQSSRPIWTKPFSVFSFVKTFFFEEKNLFDITLYFAHFVHYYSYGQISQAPRYNHK